MNDDNYVWSLTVFPWRSVGGRGSHYHHKGSLHIYHFVTSKTYSSCENRLPTRTLNDTGS